MQLEDDGDIVRAIGYVVIMASYLEDVIVECVEYLICLNEICEDTAKKVRNGQASSQIKFIKQQIKLLNCDETITHNRIKTLEYISSLLEQRNIAVHGRIYATRNQGDIQKLSRGNKVDKINSDNFYSLANKLRTSISPFRSFLFLIKRDEMIRTRNINA